MITFKDFGKHLPQAVEALAWSNVKKVLVWLLPLAAASFFVFNYLTGYLYFDRIERKLEALDRIELKARETQYSDLIEKEYAEILKEIQEYELKKIRISVRPVTIDISDWLLKLLASLILPVGLFIIALIQREPGLDLKYTLLGVGLFGLLFGAVALIIPTIYTPGLSAIIVIAGEIAVLFIGNVKFS